MTVASQLPMSDPASLNVYFEASHELLQTLSEVLDIRGVFPRVSEIARRILPHDALTMTCQDEDLNVQLDAASSDDFRGLTFDLAGSAMTPELLIGDLSEETFPLDERPDWRERINAGGYRSLLRVTMQARDRLVGVAFWSKQANFYNDRHVPLARGIADHLAVGVCHERLAKTASATTDERPRNRPHRKPLAARVRGSRL